MLLEAIQCFKEKRGARDVAPLVEGMCSKPQSPGLVPSATQTRSWWLTPVISALGR